MPAADSWVVDASVLVDLVIGGRSSEACRVAMAGRRLYAPAHVDVEVTSALARLHRGDFVSRAAAGRALKRFAQAPLTRCELPPLVSGAWRRSGDLRIADAFYVELAHQLASRVLTIDVRLARASTYAELPEGLEG